MGHLLRLRVVAAAVLLSILLTSCVSPRTLFGRSRTIFRGRNHKAVSASTPPPKVATLEELNAILVRNFTAVRSFQASADLMASEGSVQTQITDYKSVPGHVLFTKEQNRLHVWANAPYLGMQLFDMVSSGDRFGMYIPKSGTLYEGQNSAAATSQNKLENLRPDLFLSSMLIRPMDPASEVVMMKDDTDEENALYRLEFNRKTADGSLVPGREIWFDREDLTVARQKEYDAKGNVISDTSYSKWQPYNGVSFPAHIDINRRIDGLGVALEINKMEMNKELTDAQFVLAASEIEGATRKELH